jgi:hypothetical protein
MTLSFSSVRSFALAALVGATGLVGTVSADPAKPKSAQPEYTSLFDGKTLQGWDGLRDHWSVRDGLITGETTKGNALGHNTFLVWTNGTVANFELHFRYRILAANDVGFGNSGVQYRSRLIDPAKFIVGGYQADFEYGTTYSGILYEEQGRGILAERGQRTRIVEENGQTKILKLGQIAPSAEIQAGIRKEQWNDYTVRAEGNHLMHFINNRMTIDVVDDQPSRAAKSGILALQLHAGPPMVVQFKDIMIKQLP